MKINSIDKKVKEHFKDHSHIDRDDLYEFYRRFEPDLNSRTFGWRIFDLKKKNIIKTIGRGVYKISDKEAFTPVIDKNMMKMTTLLIKEFHGNLDYRIWTSQWINEFSLHQTFKYFYIFEAPYDQIESVFQKLKELFTSGSVYLQPNSDIMQKYVFDENTPIIVKNLIQRSPVKKINTVKIPTLEKILVDLYCDEKIFYMYQGRELREIYRNASSKYVLNISRLLNYAKRRGREKEIKDYIALYLPDLLENIVNDQ